MTLADTPSGPLRVAAAPRHEHTLWHPVIAVDALTDQPIAATLLDTPIVLWRSADGAPHAWAQHCPHRGASFALGRVQGDRLVCGYHGWCFGGDGRVVAIPALPDRVPAPSQRARVHAAREYAGLVWVKLEQPATADDDGDSTGTGTGTGTPTRTSAGIGIGIGIDIGTVASTSTSAVTLAVTSSGTGTAGSENVPGQREGPGAPVAPAAKTEPAVDAPPPFPAEDDARLRKLTCGPYDVATSAPRIVDNFLDMAHFGFVHDGILGTPEHTAIGDYRVEVTPNGLLATGCQAWQPQPSAGASGGGMVEYTYRVVAPYSAVLTKSTTDADTAPDAIGLFVCPVTEDTSRVWMRLAVADTTSTDAELRAFQDTIFTQDQPILESQRPTRLPTSPGLESGELHCAADRSGAGYRRYLRAAGIRYGTVWG